MLVAWGAMKALKVVGKVLLTLVVFLVVLALVVMGLRAYNHSKYPLMAGELRADSAEVADGEDNGASIRTARIDGEAISGVHLTPERKAHPGVVVVYGGSDGGRDKDRAEWLASEGYEVLSMYFFGQDNQEPMLANVPLEQFDQVTDYIAANTDGGPVTVIGTSKGAEFTELLAQYGFAVDNLVAFVPGHYSYTGLGEQGRYEEPSFTHQGEAVPYASFRAGSIASGLKLAWDMATGYPPAYRPAYESAADAADDTARIDLSGFDGNVLLFAGERDQMWQSDVAARALEEQGEHIEAHVYPDAGHIFFEHSETMPNGWQIMFGGTPEGNRAAYEDSRAVLLERLAQWHDKG